ncbi:MAG: hypothetical protein ACRDM7_08750 [Thermoleophilaceae bacterium]
MRDASLARLEWLLRQARYPGPDQPTCAYLEGTLLAYERIGALSSSEADRWRVRLAGAATERDTEPEPPLPEAVRAAGIRYLERLVADVPRLRRNPTPEERAAGAECSSALEALRAVGVLDEREHSEWSRGLLAAQAPWLDDPPPPGEGPWAISIPPETPEEAAEAAAFEAAWAARPKAETTRRVVTGSPERHAGLAMIALAVHEDATGLHFHFVGEPAPVDEPSPHSMRAFDDALDALVPPALRDDRGTAYEPVEPRPVSASSHSSEPDSDPRLVIIGAWLYTPAAPDEAATFEIEQAGGRWTLPVAT